jgi:hypothetical protein
MSKPSMNSRSLLPVAAGRLAGIALAMALALPTGVSGARAAGDYSFADAAYVTTSRNIDVLEYVVCLEAAVNRSPEAMPLAEALRTAAGACRDIAKRLPNSADEPTAKDLVDTIRECGFFPEQASPDADCGGGTSNGLGGGAGGGQAASGPDAVELTPTIIGVGTWPEGIVFDDEWLWVAESGDRVIAKVDLAAGQVVERRKVGRLPVDMATAGEGVVYTLVVTDKLINKQDGRSRSSTLAKLSECAETMADGIDFLWVVTLPNCGSDQSRLVRIDPATGKQAKSAVLGEWALAATAQGPDVWIAHARAPALTAVDQRSMKARTFDLGGAELWTISANSVHVFAGGRRAGSDADGLVAMIDPATGAEMARASVTERISEIYSDEDDVIAVGDKGTIWLYAAADLALRRTITSSTGPFEPRDIIVLDGRLVMSVANFNGERGAIFLLDDWLPSDTASGAAAGTALPPPVVAPPPRSTNVTPPPGGGQVAPPKRGTGVAPPRSGGVVSPPPRGAPVKPPSRVANPQGDRTGFPMAAGSWGGNVRNGPSTGAALVASLVEGEAVALLERTGTMMNGYPWFRIRFRGNQTGYKWGGILCATVTPVAGVEGTCTNAAAGAGKAKAPKGVNPQRPADGVAAGGAIRERHLPVDPGAGPVVRADGIPRGGRDAYRIFAQAGEMLTVDVSAPDDNAAFEIRIGDTGGRPLPGAGGRDEARFWSGIAPRDGDYLIIVGPRFGGTDYTLSVSLDLQQQPGADGHEDGEPEIAAEPAEDPRARQDYSMVSDGDKQVCSSQHSVRTSAFFDCLEGFKQQALAANPAATPDKRPDAAYSGLANGAYQSCALTHGESSNAYYVCLNEMVDYAASQSVAPDPAVDPLAGKDYSMIDHDVRRDCQARNGDATPAFVECMDIAKAAVEERDRLAAEARAEQERLDEEARLQEQARLDEEARLEQERLDEEARQQEQARLDEEARLEQARIDEEVRVQAEADAQAEQQQEQVDEPTE